jgi:hypothetical protein
MRSEPGFWYPVACHGRSRHVTSAGALMNLGWELQNSDTKFLLAHGVFQRVNSGCLTKIHVWGNVFSLSKI